jgi:hypothetical protein
MELMHTSTTVFSSSTSAVSPSSGHNSAYENIWSASGRSASVTLQSKKLEAPLIGDHTVIQALSLVSLAELDAKIFESVELSSSDIKFLNSVTESYAKKKASAKKRR